MAEKPAAAEEKTQKPERTGGRSSIGDFFKKKKEDKKFFLKVGIGIGLVLLLIIIIIVVAAVVPKGRSNEESVTPAPTSVGPSTQAPAKNIVINISSNHLIQLGASRSLTSLLAIDDATESYVIQVDEEFRSIYYIVKFKQRSQIYVGIQKEPNEAGSKILENTVLFCVSRGLESSFNGQFLNAASMEASGRTHYTTISGSNITITSTMDSNPVTLTGPVAKVFNSSCDDLTPQDRFEWSETEQACDGNQTRVTNYGTCPSDRRCPNFDTETPLSNTKSCKTFKTCNYIMGQCDRFWTNRNPYNNLPYCNCRQKLAKEANELMCPDATNDQGECESARRRAMDVSNNAPCLCHYTIRRVFPYVGTGSQAGATRWRADSITVTGSAPNVGQCQCQR